MQLVHLQVGTNVNRWHIDKLLGEGGFGAVYLVSDSTGQYALKTEGMHAQVQILKMEVYVLMELDKVNNRHFVKIADKGRFGDFNYMVMTLVGKSLQDLCKVRPNGCFSMGTSLGASIQALEALEDLHRIGYLHRDVKAGNFAIGRPERNETRKLYVLDFGMCRKYVGSSGTIRRPRSAAGFRGTARYAPISCHMERELCRKDDVESWIYMVIEYTVGRLPWRDVGDMNQIGEFKKRCRQEPGLSQMLTGCAPELRQILQLVDSCRYYDAPPYEQIYGLMRQSFTTTGSREHPYDWEQPAGGFGGGGFGGPPAPAGGGGFGGGGFGAPPPPRAW